MAIFLALVVRNLPAAVLLGLETMPPRIRNIIPKIRSSTPRIRNLAPIGLGTVPLGLGAVFLRLALGIGLGSTLPLFLYTIEAHQSCIYNV